MTRPRLPRRPHPTASRDRTASLITLQPLPTTMSYANLKGFPPRPFADQRKVSSVVLSGPPWLKRCSSRPFATLRGQKGVLRDPSRRIKERCSPRPLRGQKRCSSRPFAPLRGSKKGVLRAPPRTKKVFFAALRGQKGVLRDPSRPFADQRKVFSASLRVLRGQKGVLRDPSRPFADQRKVFSAPLRGQKRCSSAGIPFVDKKVFFATLRAPSRIKERCS